VARSGDQDRGSGDDIEVVDRLAFPVRSHPRPSAIVGRSKQEHALGMHSPASRLTNAQHALDGIS
jgi:hypothetical protein